MGGKGGVGKTTCAAAAAIVSARSGQRTLLISTDPAHSLGDALRQPLGAAPRKIATVPRLEAVELDASRALDRWLAERRGTLEQIALRGTWLDQEDVSRLLELSLPGIDELAALLELSRFAGTRRYDAVIVDTAPTGHTLRMLTMPGVLASIASVFDHMQDKHRTIVAALRGGWAPDAADALVADLAREAAEMSASLKDSSRSDMWWVTLPEPMSVAETSDALAALTAAGITVTRVIVNRITSLPPQPCRWCTARRSFEQHSVAALRRLFHGALSGVAARDTEPTGVRALSAIAGELRIGAGLSKGRGGVQQRVRAKLPRLDLKAAAPDSENDLRLILFGGKGGVGKTTCAAAVALAAVERDPSRRVLLMSTDPAHSLVDVLGTRRYDSNPSVRELDASRLFADVRERYTTAIDALFDRMSSGSSLDATHDRRIMRDLIELAPPGIDELVAVIEVTDMLLADRPEYDLVVIDTAPSGHALRLLEMPALVQDWTRALMSILLKYQPVLGLGALGAMLLGLSQGLGRLRELLADPVRARFVAVTRPAALPRAETGRLLRGLEAIGIATPTVIVNAAGAGDCSRCARARRLHAKEIAALRRTIGRSRTRRHLLVAPAEVPPPAGAAGLIAWHAGWRLLAGGT